MLFGGLGIEPLGGTALLEKVHCMDRNLRVPSLTPLPACSLCFLCAGKGRRGDRQAQKLEPETEQSCLNCMHAVSNSCQHSVLAELESTVGSPVYNPLSVRSAFTE